MPQCVPETGPTDTREKQLQQNRAETSVSPADALSQLAHAPEPTQTPSLAQQDNDNGDDDVWMDDGDAGEEMK